MPRNVRTARTARTRFWTRTKALTVALLSLWLTVNLAVPWFARDLSNSRLLGFPAGYWLAAEGALVVYLIIIVAYVWGMDRLEADCLAGAGACAGVGDPAPGAHGDPGAP